MRTSGRLKTWDFQIVLTFVLVHDGGGGVTRATLENDHETFLRVTGNSPQSMCTVTHA